jgi:hypothetical protein
MGGEARAMSKAGAGPERREPGYSRLGSGHGKVYALTPVLAGVAYYQLPRGAGMHLLVHGPRPLCRERTLQMIAKG